MGKAAGEGLRAYYKGKIEVSGPDQGVEFHLKGEPMTCASQSRVKG